jgi:hypothetical protein
MNEKPPRARDGFRVCLAGKTNLATEDTEFTEKYRVARSFLLGGLCDLCGSWTDLRDED